ncbi:MAG: PAS domain S-box protein, partial [Candidatus Omnitrophota bacterium]
HSDGSFRDVLLTAAPVQMNDPSAGVIVVIEDITESKKVQEALRAAETRYRMLFENSPDGVVILDPDTARPLEFNETVCRQLGYSREEFARLSLADYEVSETPEAVKAHISKIMREGRSDFETRHRTRQGEIRNIFVTAQLINVMGKPVYYCVWRDITDLKKAEEELRLHSEILEHMDEAVYLVRVEDGVIVYTNPRFEMMFGYSHNELLGKNVSIVNAPAENSPEAAAKKILGVLEEKGFWQGEVRNIKKDGTVFWCYANVSVFVHPRYGKVCVSIHTDITARKLAEESLRASETAFRELFESISSGVAIYDVKNDGSSAADYIVKDFNKAALSWEKRDKKDVVGKSLAELRPNIDKFGIIPVFKNVWQTGVPEYYPAKMYIDKNFSNWYENHVYRLSSGEIVAVFDDVTNFKKTEEELRLSLEWLGVAQRASNAGFWDWDMISGKLTWSVEFYTLFGLDANAGASFDIWLKVLHPDDREAAMERIDRSIKEHLPLENEYRIFLPVGGERWISSVGKTFYRESGEPERMCGICIDITERKKAEAELMESREYLNALINTIADPIFVKDRRHRFVLVNDAFCKLTGRKPEEQIGKADYDFFPKEQVDVFLQYDEQVFNTGESSMNEESITGGGGSVSTILTQKSLYTDKKGNKYIVGVIRDITYMKDLEQKERLAQLGRLVADMAHEVSNPLMIISGNAQLSLMEDIANDKVKENLSIIMKESQRAKDIIQRLLKFSRPSKGEIKEVDINKIVEAVCGIVEHQFSLINVTVNKSLAQGLPLVMFDEQQMHEVLMNLINNAKDAMPGGGMIEVRTSVDRDKVRIDIKDSGCGMSEEVRLKVFEPFFTTKEKGTGLGLSICNSIILAHKGELKVESRVGKGTVFSIILPGG